MRTVHRLRPLMTLMLAPVIAWGLAPRPALAAWPYTPTTNLPICTTAPDQGVPSIVSDGSGGAIIAFTGIFAQHVTASGVVDPGWPLNGRKLSTALFVGIQPNIASDGAGGALVAWQEFRSGSYDIYAQHILSTGVVDPAWPVEGRALCSFTGDQTLPMIVPDGAGGAIVAWQDGRLVANLDVFAAHVLASGAADPAWPANGLAICQAANDQSSIQIASDGAGGAIISWQDNRGANTDIYAQHALPGGTVDPAWPANGRQLCAAANNQTTPTIVSDGAGGAIVTWTDLRGAGNDIYAQHVLGSGGVDASWPIDGRILCQAANNQIAPAIATDGAGGAIVTWQDLRSGSYDIYAQHVAANGFVDSSWPADGRLICGAAINQFAPTIIPDGFGGAIVAWYDFRNGTANDIYAQHVKPDGTVDTDWPTDGRAISSATNSQFTPVMASDGAYGAIVTWADLRAGTGQTDIYAERVARFGYLGTPEAEIASVRDVPGDNGGKLKLSWNASYLDITGDRDLSGFYTLQAYDVLRSVPPQAAAARLQRGARAVGSPGEALPSGGDRLLVTQTNAQTYYWEYLSSISALHYVSGYSFIAPTLEDSTSGGAPRTAFMVVARNGGSKFWPSRPDSGYSVDNLPPLTPAPFTGNFGAGSTALHWDPNGESDLAGYRLYRGSSAGFVPGPSNLVAALTDTGYVDPAGAPYFYKLAAIDIHGNLSGFALLQPGGTLDVPGERLEFALDPVRPNPARGDELIAQFTLASQAPARIELLDVAGRRVASRDLGARGPGRYSVNLSEHGRIPPGIYVVRLTQGARSVTRRAAVLP